MYQVNVYPVDAIPEPSPEQKLISNIQYFMGHSEVESCFLEALQPARTRELLRRRRIYNAVVSLHTSSKK